MKLKVLPLLLIAVGIGLIVFQPFASITPEQRAFSRGKLIDYYNQKGISIGQDSIFCKQSDETRYWWNCQQLGSLDIYDVKKSYHDSSGTLFYVFHYSGQDILIISNYYIQNYERKGIGSGWYIDRDMNKKLGQYQISKCFDGQPIEQENFGYCQLSIPENEMPKNETIGVPDKNASIPDKVMDENRKISETLGYAMSIAGIILLFI